MSRLGVCFILLLGLSLPNYGMTASTPATSPKLPTDVVRAYIAELQKPVTHQSPTLNTIGQYLDIQSIAKVSLDKHWNTLKGKQKQEFLRLFSILVNRFFADSAAYQTTGAQQVFKKEEIAGALAKVYMTVPKSDVPVEHVVELHQVSGQWKICNNIKDGVSLTENFRRQFNKIIFDYGVDHLLEKMQEEVAAMEKSRG